MKLRILNNSVRFRLSQSEVSTFLETGKVEAKSQIGLSVSGALVYSLEKSNREDLSATFVDGHIKILVPKKLGEDWATTNQVGMEGEKKLDEMNKLRILVEKDFRCPTPRQGEDEGDNFPNPNHPC